MMRKFIMLATVGLMTIPISSVESYPQKDEKEPSALYNKQGTPKTKKWGDSMFLYAIEDYLPPSKYNWNWRDALILRGVADIYQRDSEMRDQAFKYLEECIANTLHKAHARHPNGVATAFALPLLYKQTGHQKYMDKALELYQQYMEIPRSSLGGVSHRPNTVELWDDTVYMIELFLLEMYRATGDEKYLQEVILQIIAHEKKLADPETGFWYHGWDNDITEDHDHCSQPGWNNNPNRRNDEFWGRGNGWIAMSLADCLEEMSEDQADYPVLKRMFTKMMYSLVPLQDEKTGHWRQLPIHVNDADAGNYIESSGTVMFGYAIAKGISIGILPKKIFRPVLDKAYFGIEKFSIAPVSGGKYMTITNVCEGTCIGDKAYYYSRKAVNDTEFTIGAALIFDNIYRQRFDYK